MGLLLGFGDAFHLIPRIIGHLTTGLDDYSTYLGYGKLITGITMTIFYYLIYLFYKEETKQENSAIHILIITLIVIRFLLLALPGNSWATNSSDLIYGIIRNVPFLMIGIIIVSLFYQVRDDTKTKLFTRMGTFIILSFVCYIIVVVGSPFIPALGALMMPKTVAYLLIIYTGYRYLTKQKILQ